MRRVSAIRRSGLCGRGTFVLKVSALRSPSLSDLTHRSVPGHCRKSTLRSGVARCGRALEALSSWRSCSRSCRAPPRRIWSASGRPPGWSSARGEGSRRAAGHDADHDSTRDEAHVRLLPRATSGPPRRLGRSPSRALAPVGLHLRHLRRRVRDRPVRGRGPHRPARLRRSALSPLGARARARPAPVATDPLQIPPQPAVRRLP